MNFVKTDEVENEEVDEVENEEVDEVENEEVDEVENEEGKNSSIAPLGKIHPSFDNPITTRAERRAQARAVNKK